MSQYTNRSVTAGLPWEPANRNTKSDEAKQLRAPRVVAYARYSNLDDSPDSIARQLKTIESYARSQGLQIVKVYEEPRATGTVIEGREQIMQMLAEIDSLDVSGIVYESADRFGRTIKVLADLWDGLQKRGIDLHNASRGMREDAVSIGIAAGIAEADRDRVVTRMRSGIIASVERGTPIMARCLGYKRALNDCDKRVFVVDEAEAETVRWIFAKFLEGLPPVDIARLLNDEQPGGRHNRSWTRHHIIGSATTHSGILRRIRYTGRQTYGITSVRKEGSKIKIRRKPREEWKFSAIVPELQIIDDDTFGRVQAKLAQMSEARAAEISDKKVYNPRWGNRGGHILQGIIRCARCGSGMSSRSDLRGNRRERFMCNRASNNSAPGTKKCEMTIDVIREVLEDSIVDLLGPELETLELSMAYVEAYNRHLSDRSAGARFELEKLESRLAEIEKELDRLFESDKKGTSSAWLQKKREALSAEFDQLTARLSELQVSRSRETPIPPPCREEARTLNGHLARLFRDEATMSDTIEFLEVRARVQKAILAIRIDAKAPNDFDLKIEICPFAFTKFGVTIPADTITLEKRVTIAVRRGYYASTRSSEIAERKEADGKHRLTDEQWDKIKNLVPWRVVWSNQNPHGPVQDARLIVEAVIFHLQTRTMLREMPAAFGDKNEVYKALRRLHYSGIWLEVEPKLWEMNPTLFKGVKGTQMFPLGNASIKSASTELTLEGKAAAGHHRLNDREWNLIKHLVPSEVVGNMKEDGTNLERRLIDGIFFRLKEDVPYKRMPKEFGYREEFEGSCRKLVAHHLWDQIVAVLKEQSPRTLHGANLGALDNHARMRCAGLAFRRYVAGDERIEYLAEIDRLVAEGMTLVAAAKKIGLSLNTLNYWRKVRKKADGAKQSAS